MEKQRIKETLVNELHKPSRKNFPRRKMVMKGIDNLWQIDLVEMHKFAKNNKGINYILTVICVFSKFAWSVPVKRKTGRDVTAAMEKILKRGRVPKNIQSDMGKEFFNSEFSALMKRYNINHYSSYSTMKAFICERFNRTLKNLMWKQFSLNGNYKWLELLPILINKYNSTVHRTINLKPDEVNSKNIEKKLLNTVYKLNPVEMKPPKFKINDRVRISKSKSVFAKGYTQNWSNEIFKIVKVQNTTPHTYLLKDYLDQPVLGGFYEQELQKTKVDEIYLIEKVIKKSGNKMFVKFLGFDKTHNAWVNKNEIMK
jgi:Integrase core domain